jgi:hypothetical protein
LATHFREGKSDIAQYLEAYCGDQTAAACSTTQSPMTSASRPWTSSSKRPGTSYDAFERLGFLHCGFLSCIKRRRPGAAGSHESLAVTGPGIPRARAGPGRAGSGRGGARIAGAGPRPQLPLAAGRGPGAGLGRLVSTQNHRIRVAESGPGPALASLARRYHRAVTVCRGGGRGRRRLSPSWLACRRSRCDEFASDSEALAGVGCDSDVADSVSRDSAPGSSPSPEGRAGAPGPGASARHPSPSPTS